MWRLGEGWLDLNKCWHSFKFLRKRHRRIFFFKPVTDQMRTAGRNTVSNYTRPEHMTWSCAQQAGVRQGLRAENPEGAQSAIMRGFTVGDCYKLFSQTWPYTLVITATALSFCQNGAHGWRRYWYRLHWVRVEPLQLFTSHASYLGSISAFTVSKPKFFSWFW